MPPDLSVDIPLESDGLQDFTLLDSVHRGDDAGSAVMGGDTLVADTVKLREIGIVVRVGRGGCRVVGSGVRLCNNGYVIHVTVIRTIAVAVAIGLGIAVAVAGSLTVAWGMGIMAAVVVAIPIAISLGGGSNRLLRAATSGLSVIVFDYEPDHGSHGAPSGIGHGTAVALGVELGQRHEQEAGLPLTSGCVGELGYKTKLADFSLYGVLGDPDTVL
jgi:hypothetical protein